MGSVVVDGLEKRFGAHRVLKGIDLAIEDGEFVALVGPSGCGKSTLLRIVAGLEDPSEGAIVINGADVSYLEPRKRDIAMVFQSYALYPDKTVQGNLEFSLKLAKMPKDEIAKRITSASRMLGLDELLHRLPKALSGGQRQRVAMGRAIVRDPAVFLFDEPLSNLDAKLRTQMRSEIKALHERLRNTAIYVTHDQVEAMTMADRIVVMRDGQIEQIGTPLEVYDRPKTRFVAEFIGSPAMNFLTGKVVPADGNPVLDLGDGMLPLAGREQVKVGQDLLCGIRPEHATVAVGSGVPIEVVTTEPLGREVLVFADVRNSAMDRSFCVAPGSRVEASRGDILHITPLTEHLHLFDAASERRVEG